VAESAAERFGLIDLLREPDFRLTGDGAIDERADALMSGELASILEESAIVEDWAGWRGTHPLLDPRFITATYGLDPWFAVRDNHDRALQPEAFRDRLPEDVRTRRSKAEFSGLVRAASGAVLPGSEELDSDPLIARGWTHADSMARLLFSADQQEFGAAHYLERTVSLARWLRQL